MFEDENRKVDFNGEAITLNLQLTKLLLVKMNSSTIQPKNRRNALLVSFAKSTDILIKQTQTKSQRTIETKVNKSIKTFSSDTPLILDNEWLLG